MAGPKGVLNRALLFLALSSVVGLTIVFTMRQDGAKRLREAIFSADVEIVDPMSNTVKRSELKQIIGQYGEYVYCIVTYFVDYEADDELFAYDILLSINTRSNACEYEGLGYESGYVVKESRVFRCDGYVYECTEHGLRYEETGHVSWDLGAADGIENTASRWVVWTVPDSRDIMLYDVHDNQTESYKWPFECTKFRIFVSDNLLVFVDRDDESREERFGLGWTECSKVAVVVIKGGRTDWMPLRTLVDGSLADYVDVGASVKPFVFESVIGLKIIESKFWQKAICADEGEDRTILLEVGDDGRVNRQQVVETYLYMLRNQFSTKYGVYGRMSTDYNVNNDGAIIQRYVPTSGAAILSPDDIGLAIPVEEGKWRSVAAQGGEYVQRTRDGKCVYVRRVGMDHKETWFVRCAGEDVISLCDNSIIVCDVQSNGASLSIVAYRLPVFGRWLDVWRNW